MEEVAVGDGAGRVPRPHDEIYPPGHPDRVDDEPELSHVGIDLQPVFFVVLKTFFERVSFGERARGTRYHTKYTIGVGPENVGNKRSRPTEARACAPRSYEWYAMRDRSNTTRTLTFTT